MIKSTNISYIPANLNSGHLLTQYVFNLYIRYDYRCHTSIIGNFIS
ncbi:hypothetical protein NARC_130058 [Candidatus Nitrosocosmicus arcticus]|uniref:Uncharacterized protein n=1 Tax=Candidatus Nitrosocosmicus arcticus TaxID=2035267 RepID=A0A557SSX9_9ARCH|nr:hypothetical protein NARC_130058 [Candidatus Nitrosocosmicus arcticus]